MRKMRRAIRGEFKKSIIAMHGNRCMNCGSATDIQWHHIVPLHNGGYDIASNIVPLCKVCHKCVTESELLLTSSLRAYKSGGRKRKAPKNHEEILDRYIECKISKSEAAEELGWATNRNFVDTVWFEEYKKKRNIKSYRNNVDIRIKNSSGIYPGDAVGWVEYNDGTKKYYFWDREYTKGCRT